jgi:DnaA family protein
MSIQIPLGLSLASSSTLDNYVGDGNEAAVDLLQRCALDDEVQLYLWGKPASGKTHLLQAACQLAADAGQDVVYLPLRELAAFGPEVLQGMEAMSLLCFDDIDAIAGDAHWERALFDTYNRARALAHHMIFSAAAAPAQCGVGLDDLVSRLGWGGVYQLQEPDDEGRLRIIQQQAQARGFAINDETGRYLLSRLPRDMQALMDFIERIDRASLEAKRKVTIPFIRDLINSRKHRR